MRLVRETRKEAIIVDDTTGAENERRMNAILIGAAAAA